MSHVLTLIASDRPLSIAHIEQAGEFIERNGIGLIGQPEWLDPHRAADVSIENALTLAQMKQLRDRFAAERIDVICTKTEGRKKKLLVADMDATIVTSETLDELAEHAGIKQHVAAITDRAMRGELDFAAAIKERVSLLKGLQTAALQHTLDGIVLTDGAEHLTEVMAFHGATCVLVSGGFSCFTGPIAKKTGFHHHHGNNLGIDGDTLDGTVAEPILGKEAKLEYLNSYARQLGLDLSETMAIGDGANDLPMLQAAGLGIGFRPKPLVEENLLNILKYADLTGALYAQGYKNLC